MLGSWKHLNALKTGLILSFSRTWKTKSEVHWMRFILEKQRTSWMGWGKEPSSCHLPPCHSPSCACGSVSPAVICFLLLALPFPTQSLSTSLITHLTVLWKSYLLCGVWGTFLLCNCRNAKRGLNPLFPHQEENSSISSAGTSELLLIGSFILHSSESST